MSYSVTLAELPSRHTAVVRGRVAHDGIGAFLGTAFGETMGVITGQGQQPSGPPFGRYREAEGGWDVEAGFPVQEPIQEAGNVHPGTLPGGHAAKVLHVGAYDQVAGAWQAAMDWVVENGFQVSDAPWEQYLDGPEVAEPRTEIFVPCREAHR